MLPEYFSLVLVGWEERAEPVEKVNNVVETAKFIKFEEASP